MKNQSVPVIDTMSTTFQFVRRTLFDAFQAKKWLFWGFLAFLGTNLSSGGGFGGGPGRWLKHRNPDWGKIHGWLNEHLTTIITLGVIVLLIVAIITALWLYIRSRGRFMFLECLVEDKLAIVESWHHNSREALSLFFWYVGYGAFAFLFFLLVVIGALSIIFQNGQPLPWSATLPKLLLLGVASLVIFIPMGIITVFLEDFVVPLMWARKIRVLEAWSQFIRLFKTFTGTFILYFLWRILLSIAAGAILVLGTCLTCCLAAIPVVGQTIFLPIYVFMRMYPVMILARMEPDLATRLTPASVS